MITLYQFQSCPFCSKVRALLNFTKTPYKTVEVSPFGMKELDFTDHKKVPVIKDVDADGNEKIIVESSKIIEYVNENYSKLAVNDEDKIWTDWVDNTLVHYLPALIHPNFETSRRNFKKIILPGQFGWLKGKFIRFAGAVAMPRVARKLMKKYDIKHPEEEFFDAIDHWVDKGLNNQSYYGGDTPNFVDCSVFGVLRSGHQLGVVKPAMRRRKEFAIWYDKCYPMMTGERLSNAE